MKLANEGDTDIQSSVFEILEKIPVSPCVCDLAISSANAVESLMAQAGIQSESTVYHPGLTRNYSRGSIDHFPDAYVRTIKQEKGKKKEALRTIALQRIQQLLGDDSLQESDVGIRRLLDSPRICQAYISYCVISQLTAFEELVGRSPYVLRRQSLYSTINKTKHTQRASLGSYISRAFSPDELPAITTRKGKKGNIEARRELIENLPIEPSKISDEVLIKLGLTPPDYKHYTLQARLRYKLAIRKHFLSLFARAQVIDRPQSDKETARICTLPDASGNHCIAIFRTVTDLIARQTGKEKPKRRFHKISRVACSIFRSPEEALRSQMHAIEKLTEKVDAYAHLHQTFQDYQDVAEEDLRKFLIADALEICKNRESFYDTKLCELLVQLFQKPHNALIVGHITNTFYAALRDAIAKKNEISGVLELLQSTDALNHNDNQ